MKRIRLWERQLGRTKRLKCKTNDRKKGLEKEDGGKLKKAQNMKSGGKLEKTRNMKNGRGLKKEGKCEEECRSDIWRAATAVFT